MENYSLLKELGRGGFARVMLVLKKNGSDKNNVYAMKIQDKYLFHKHPHLMKWLEREKDIMVILRGDPFFTKLHYAFQTSDQLMLVMQYEKNGTLYEALKHDKFSDKHDQLNNKLSFETKTFYFSSVAIALDHLHKLQIIHRDLKLVNIFIGLDGHAVLADFGCSVIHKSRDKLMEAAGTPSSWVSLKRNPTNKLN